MLLIVAPERHDARRLIERNRGHVLRQPAVDPVEHAGALLLVENPIGLVQVGRDEPLAVPRDVVVAAATVDRGPEAVQAEPRELGHVEPRLSLNRV